MGSRFYLEEANTHGEESERIYTRAPALSWQKLSWKAVLELDNPNGARQYCASPFLPVKDNSRFPIRDSGIVLLLCPGNEAPSRIYDYDAVDLYFVRGAQSMSVHEMESSAGQRYELVWSSEHLLQALSIRP